MRCRLIDWKSDFFETRNLQQMFSQITLKVIQGHVANNLLKHNIIFVLCEILGEVISEYRNLLVRTTLTSFDVSEIQFTILI